jgi:ATP-dependent DNA helicase PIF1
MTAILNEIREGVLLGHAQEQLNARADAEFIPPDDEFWLTLTPTNRLVTARNRQHLERLPATNSSTTRGYWATASTFRS